MTETPPPGAADAARVHGDAAALAAVTVTKLAEPRLLSQTDAEALLGTTTAPAAAKPAAKSSTILAAITAAAPAVVLLADDIGRVVHGPALNLNDQVLAAGGIVTLAGAAVAIWGRWRATAPISGLLRVRT